MNELSSVMNNGNMTMDDKNVNNSMNIKAKNMGKNSFERAFLALSIGGRIGSIG